MRKIILSVAITLDGFIEGPNGEYDWCFTDQNYGLDDLLNRVDTAFLGRKTYELTKSMNSNDESGLPDLKQYIFSTTMSQVKEGEKLISGNIQTEVEKIKNDKGKDIWLFGGASLSASLLNLKLVDEISLAVHPLLLGQGKLLFNNIKQRINLSLIGSQSYSTGLVTLNYNIDYNS
jgi:dihydrofolate reductase